jgi:hypothetical protein
VEAERGLSALAARRMVSEWWMGRAWPGRGRRGKGGGAWSLGTGEPRSYAYDPIVSSRAVVRRYGPLTWFVRVWLLQRRRAARRGTTCASC